MERIAVAGFALLAAIAVAGCSPKPAAPAESAAPVDPVDEVTQAIDRWRQAYEARSMDQLAGCYLREPGLVVVQDGIRHRGWDAIEPGLRDRLARAGAIRIGIKDLQVAPLGSDAATAVATMTRELTEGATTVTENGVITLVVRRTDAGWVIVSEHYSYKRP
jgi:uncharacterized protein (TIGR02246 family)